VQITAMTPAHAGAVLALYQAGIDAGHATFETHPAGIFPESSASLHLHQAAGFRVIGTRERIGRHHGRWRDVLFIQRRSTII
jgi:L-amino acid N-acyltransferase YncA